MKLRILLKKILLCCLFMLAYSFSIPAQQTPPVKLWYKEPADASIPDLADPWKDDAEWLKALPLGNGSLGAMIFGDVNKERIQLNEKTLCSGSKQDSDNPDAYQYLDSIRQLLFAGKYEEATELTNRTQLCKGKGSGLAVAARLPYGSYQTLGDLWLDFGTKSKYKNYGRELYLNEAIARVTYQQQGRQYSREIFISYPAGAMILRLAANKKAAINVTASLTRPESFSTAGVNGEVTMSGVLDNGKGGNGISYIARLKAKLKGGWQYIRNNQLVIEKADEVILIFTAATDYLPLYPDYKGNEYKNISKRNIVKAASLSYGVLKKAHIADHSKYFNRVSLQLDSSKDTVPTNIRVKQFKLNNNDKQLQQLYFQLAGIF